MEDEGMDAKHTARLLALVALSSLCTVAWAQSRVTYGRITAVTMTQDASGRAQTGGALVGGALGLVSGSGQSSSNRALRGIGGAVAGQQIGRLASNRPVFEYTILIGGTSTITMVTDEAGLRVGDCVAVERGQFNNLRLVDDARCAPRAAVPQNAVREANACVQAKDALLQANTDDEFDRAERRVRLLCGD
jgi:outer membrane lipoprotein SlyB